MFRHALRVVLMLPVLSCGDGLVTGDPGVEAGERETQSAPAGTVRLYRLYRTPDHFYTTSAQERSSAVSLGYQLEGEELYVYPYKAYGTTALYRWYNATSGDHFYTVKSLSQIPGYRYEGVACYVLSSRQPGSVSFFRWYNPSSGDHFYTKAYRTAIPGYVFERVEGFVYGKDRVVSVYAHQDDDLLWMLPYFGDSDQMIYAAMPYTTTHQSLVSQLPLDFSAEWRHPWGWVSDGTFWNTYLNACARKDIITVANIKDRIRPYLADASVSKILTHNNWGEYGHLHHRLVNQAVRELAAAYGKDVWALAARADASGPGKGYPDTGTFGLESEQRSFDHATFTALKQVYQRTYLSGYGWDLWTWHDGELEYPTGARSFIKIVSKGVDLTVNNPGIQSLVKSMPTTGACQ